MNKPTNTTWPLLSYLLVFFCLIYLLTESSLLRALPQEEDEAHRSGNESIRNRNNVMASLLEQQVGRKQAVGSELRYCNTGDATGAEGPIFEGSDEWVLHHLLFNIRHGDRSSIHNIPGAQSLSAQVNSKENKYLDHRALKYLPFLRFFVLKSIDESLPNMSIKNSEGDTLPDALSLSQVFTQSDSDIPPGILTTRGFMQHILLGKHLSKAYRFYLETLTAPDDLYIRSTNYRRTILSVVALMVYLSIVYFVTISSLLILVYMYSYA